MAACNIQALLDNARCFHGMSPHQLDSITLQLWCLISGDSPPPASGGNWWNPDVGAPILGPDGPWDNPDV